MPLFNPLSVSLVAVVSNSCDGWAAPLMYGVTTYPVIGEKPLDDGAVHETVAEATPAVAVPMVGAPGTVAGVTELEAPDWAPVPTPLVAATLNV